MDHLVIVDDEAKELDRLVAKHKTIIIRTADEAKTPFREVTEGEVLYFISTARPGVVLGKARVKSVLYAEHLDPEECIDMINRFLMEMMLTEKQLFRCEGKPFVSLIRVEEVTRVEPFQILDNITESMGDWKPVENIKSVQKNILIM
jgi:hypothetical protein